MVRVTDGDTQADGVVVNVLVRLRVDVNEFETEAELVYVALVVPSEVCAISKTRLARSSRMACCARNRVLLAPPVQQEQRAQQRETI